MKKDVSTCKFAQVCPKELQGHWFFFSPCGKTVTTTLAHCSGTFYLKLENESPKLMLNIRCTVYVNHNTANTHVNVFVKSH